MKKINVHVGDDINVDVCQPKFGKFPIGRYQGMICKLTLPDSIKRLEYGCTVLAKVGMVKERSLSVMVIEVIVSAAANKAITANKVVELKEKYAKSAKVSKTIHKQYPYMSKQELNNI